METEVVTPDPPTARTAWIVAAFATAVALVAITALVTSAVVDGDGGRRTFDQRLVRAARIGAPLGHRLAGEISSIEGSSFMLGDTKVSTNGDTTFRQWADGSLAELEFADLKVGDRVVVRSARFARGDNAVHAKRVLRTD